MHVSQETQAQTESRLQDVIRHAELVIHDGTFAFRETPADQFPVDHVQTALAFVRDEDVWSALLPSCGDEVERFTLFSFHFPIGLDNSGFVGWLATHIKRATGSGVLVVCGNNSRRGGIFDYWGAPLEAAEQVLSEVKRLRSN